MAINWFKNSEVTGIATINKNNIVLNKTFINKFENATNAVIGLSDEGEIVVKPLTLDDLDNPLIKDLLIVKVSPFNNILRIGNTKCVSLIEEALNQKVTSDGLKFKTIWDDKENSLVIKTNK